MSIFQKHCVSALPEHSHKDAQQAKRSSKDYGVGWFLCQRKNKFVLFSANNERANIISRRIPEINGMLGTNWRFQQNNYPAELPKPTYKKCSGNAGMTVRTVRT